MLKLTLRLTLIITLFCSSAFAEGDMTSGGKGDSGGGLVCAECITDQTDTKDNYDDSLMEFIRAYFYKIIG